MKIVHTPPRYAPHIGGVEAVAQQICERLRRRGDDTSVICADEPVGGPGMVNGVPVRRLPYVAKVANTNLTLGLPWALSRADVDIVHTHIPTPWTADVSVLVARLRRKRAVVQFHNEIVGDGLNGLVATAYQRSVQRLTMRLASVVLVLSQPWADRLQRQYPVVRGKIHVVPNGVDVERFRPPGPDEARGSDLLFVSVLDAFHAYKGLEVLLRALPSVPQAVLRVVGDGSRRAGYETLADELGIGDRCHFLGAVDDAQLDRLYRTCGIFVLPSRYAAHEGGSSLVVMEGMAAGLPVVVAEGAGDIAWQVEAVDAGLRVPAADVSALAEALGRLLDDAPRRQQMGARARAHVVAHHSWDVIVEQIRSHY